jgi:transposase
MSMHPRGIEAIPQETQRVAHACFPKGTILMRLRDELGPISHDEDFRARYPRRGQPAQAPWRLALITVLQAMENLSDRQAALMVQARIDWKYALSLSLDDPGFDFSVLSEFRDRLRQGDLSEEILEPILKICRSHRWLKAGGSQRTDSTIVLAAVRTLNSVEAVGETLRAALNDLAEDAPTWLLSVVPESWFERYGERIDLQRVGKSATQRDQWRDQIGTDAFQLLEAARQPDAPQPVSTHPCIELLAQVWGQHYQDDEQGVHWRDGPQQTNAERIISPYDPEARASRKRETSWIGYKVHLTETCSREPGQPNLIIEVTTTVATTQDVDALEGILHHTREQSLGSREHLVDQGYMSGEHLVQQRKLGTELIGPVPAAGGWQKGVEAGLTQETFTLDWEAKVAICPAGEQSVSWKEKKDRRGKKTEEVRFAAKICKGCALKERCCRGETGRILSLVPQEQYDALQERRAEQVQPSFVKRYGLRAGMEASISQGVRRTGLRQARYLGRSKTHAQHVVSGAALNLLRLNEHVLRLQTGHHAGRSRFSSRFKRLQSDRPA